MFTADQILNLLLIKHSKDVCVPECKGGPTWFGRHDRMDLWTMARSWAHPRCCAYEIKVSRSDFVNDKKWMAYLEYCNELYFVAPWGVIAPDEAPEQVGLILSSKNGTRLYTKKKAPYREVDIPETLFRYILMSRARISDQEIREHRSEDARDYWRSWLKRKDEDKQLGHRVSIKIRELISKRILEVERDNRELEARTGKYKELAELLDKMGVNPNSYRAVTDLEKKLQAQKSGMCQEVDDLLDGVIRDLQFKRQHLKNIGEGK